MAAHNDTESTNTPPDPRELGKWAHRYAQNRSLAVAVSVFLLAALSLILGAASALGGWAYHTGHSGLFGLCVLLAVAAMLATFYMSVPRWGTQLVRRITEALYAGEGSAQLECPCSPSRRWLGGLCAAVFGGCILLSMLLMAWGWYPEAYMQPVSALYCVPFVVAIWLLQRPASSPFLLLWPTLYTLHAALILAGAPIVFTGPWSILNMLIPVAGYGILSALLSHLYSRYALRKLRRLSGGVSEETAAGGER